MVSTSPQVASQSGQIRSAVVVTLSLCAGVGAVARNDFGDEAIGGLVTEPVGAVGAE